MEVYRKQVTHGGRRYLVLTDPDLKTGAARAVVVDAEAQTIKRVPNLQTLLRQSRWEPVTGSDPTLDALVQSVPALRRYRGIEIKLATGETAWVRWRQWSSGNADTEALLSKTTGPLSVPAYEPDGDYYLAMQAVTILGGEVLDLPRSALTLGEAAY